MEFYMNTKVLKTCVFSAALSSVVIAIETPSALFSEPKGAEILPALLSKPKKSGIPSTSLLQKKQDELCRALIKRAEEKANITTQSGSALNNCDDGNVSVQKRHLLNMITAYCEDVEKIKQSEIKKNEKGFEMRNAANAYARNVLQNIENTSQAAEPDQTAKDDAERAVEEAKLISLFVRDVYTVIDPSKEYINNDRDAEVLKLEVLLQKGVEEGTAQKLKANMRQAHNMERSAASYQHSARRLRKDVITYLKDHRVHAARITTRLANVHVMIATQESAFATILKKQIFDSNPEINEASKEEIFARIDELTAEKTSLFQEMRSREIIQETNKAMQNARAKKYLMQKISKLENKVREQKHIIAALKDSIINDLLKLDPQQALLNANKVKEHENLKTEYENTIKNNQRVLPYIW